MSVRNIVTRHCKAHSSTLQSSSMICTEMAIPVHTRRPRMLQVIPWSPGVENGEMFEQFTFDFAPAASASTLVRADLHNRQSNRSSILFTFAFLQPSGLSPASLHAALQAYLLVEAFSSSKPAVACIARLPSHLHRICTHRGLDQDPIRGSTAAQLGCWRALFLTPRHRPVTSGPVDQ